jgi:hypothetical protein
MSKFKWIQETPLEVLWSDEDQRYLATSKRKDFTYTTHGLSPVEAIRNLTTLLDFVWETEVNMPRVPQDRNKSDMFYVSEKHLQLLTQISWDFENGVITQNHKYPFGDSNKQAAIQKVFDIYPADPAEEDVSEAQWKHIESIAEDMKKVLQIGCQFLKFEAGWYVKRTTYGSAWDRVADVPTQMKFYLKENS